jgi:uncharacterized membrane protein
VTVTVLLLGALVLYVLWRHSRLEADIEELRREIATLARSRESGIDRLERSAAPVSPSVSAASAAATPAVATRPSGAPPTRPIASQPGDSRSSVRIVLPTLPRPSLNLEQQIGGRVLLYVGIVAIVVGASYFEKLAMDNGWIGEMARVLQGGAVGLGLIIAGLWFNRRGYGIYGQMVSASGIAILYLCVYAAYSLYGLIGQTTSLVLMTATTVFAAGLADHQRSLGLGILAVAGGFAAPVLLHSGIDPYIALFVFDTFLIAGTIYLAQRRGWPQLTAVSYGALAISLVLWGSDFYRPSEYLWTEIFLTIFSATYIYLLEQIRRADRGVMSPAQAILWTVPPAYYAVSLAILFDRSGALLIFLTAMSVVGFVAGRLEGSIARLAFWLGAIAPLIAWAGSPVSRDWTAAGLASAAAIYVAFLAATTDAERRRDGGVTPADLVLLHANPLGAFAVAYALLAPGHAARAGWLALAFAAWHGGQAIALAPHRRDAAVHAAAVGFTLAVVSMSLLLSGVWLTAGWAAEGAIVIALGLRERRDWLRIAGGGMLVVAILRLLFLLFSSPWLRTLLFNRRAGCAAFVIALAYALAWLHHRFDGVRHRIEIATAIVIAQGLTIALFTSEIVAYWSTHGTGRQGALVQGVMLSTLWCVYATVLIIVGILKRYAPIRYTAMVLFAVAIIKVFAFDLAELERIYRVASIVGLGIALLTASYLYQRFRVELPADNAN